MGITSDRGFLAIVAKRLGGLSPKPPKQPGFHKRRQRLTETIEWLLGAFALVLWRAAAPPGRGPAPSMTRQLIESVSINSGAPWPPTP
jgi:hypothetical protein